MRDVHVGRRQPLALNVRRYVDQPLLLLLVRQIHQLLREECARLSEPKGISIDGMAANGQRTYDRVTNPFSLKLFPISLHNTGSDFIVFVDKIRECVSVEINLPPIDWHEVGCATAIKLVNENEEIMIVSHFV